MIQRTVCTISYTEQQGRRTSLRHCLICELQWKINSMLQSKLNGETVTHDALDNSINWLQLPNIINSSNEALISQTHASIIHGLRGGQCVSPDRGGRRARRERRLRGGVRCDDESQCADVKEQAGGNDVKKANSVKGVKRSFTVPERCFTRPTLEALHSVWSARLSDAASGVAVSCLFAGKDENWPCVSLWTVVFL